MMSRRRLRQLPLLTCLFLLLTRSSRAQECTDGTCECRDLSPDCLQWATTGKCSTDYSVKTQCPKACRVCWSCDDEDEACNGWANGGECNKNPRYMLVYCPKSCNVCHFKGDLNALMEERLKEEAQKEQEALQLLKTKYGVEQVMIDDDEKTKKTYDEMVTYMDAVVANDEGLASVRDQCLNRSPNCAYWASIGECENTREYMVVQCAPACKSCDLLIFENRCPYDPDEPGALVPGDLHKLFDKLVTFKKYEPHILSQPNSTSDGIVDGPWVVTLDKFMTPQEAERLIELGAAEGYKQSADVGAVKFDGTLDQNVNTGRTSTNAWCQNACQEDPVTKAVEARIEEILGIPQANFEYLQMLRYEMSQFYQVHHDYIAFHQQRKQGVRTLTVFLYLNDVEEGGGTNFPNLNLTVQPKVGRALIWPSVLNEDPNAKDERTDHQALPVVKGVKYGANAWIHQRDFKEPFSRACI